MGRKVARKVRLLKSSKWPEEACYPRFGLLQIKKVQLARFRVKTRRIIITIRKFHVYTWEIKKKIIIKKKRKELRKRAAEDVHRNCIGKVFATGELIVYKYSVAGWSRAYMYQLGEATSSVFVSSTFLPLYLCRLETLLSHARRITRVSHARAFTTTRSAVIDEISDRSR